MNKPIEFRADRHPAESYEDILDRDTREVPEKLREQEVRDIGAEPGACFALLRSRLFRERD
jgi:hypothetical protein